MTLKIDDKVKCVSTKQLARDTKNYASEYLEIGKTYTVQEYKRRNPYYRVATVMVRGGSLIEHDAENFELIK